MEATCKFCGVTFHTKQCLVDIGWGKFCSPECATNSKKKGTTKVCEECGAPFYAKRACSGRPEQRFCSKECTDSARKDGKINTAHPGTKGELSPVWKGGKQTVTCTQCGKQFERVRSWSSEHSCCSMKCWGQWCSEHIVGEAHHQWTGGRKPYPAEWTPTIKKAVRERWGYKCVVCGAQQYGRRLCVHHVNYKQSDCEFGNLVPLCISCHVKTNTQRGIWQVLFSEMLQEEV